MMSTAVVMIVGGEQTKMRSATSDRIDGGEMTFAQSFDERVGLSKDMQTKSRAGDAIAETQGGKSSGQLKNLDTPPVASAGAKVDVVASRGATELDETKGLAMKVVNGKGASLPVETDFVARADISDRVPSKTTPQQLPPDHGELQQKIGAKVVARAGASQTKTDGTTSAIGNEEQLLGDGRSIEARGVVSKDVLAVEPTMVDPLPQESSATADRSLLSQNEIQPLVQNQTVLTGKSTEVASVQKDTKTKQSEAGTKVAPKTIKATESVPAVGDASTVTEMQGVTPLPIQVFASNGEQRNTADAVEANVSDVLSTTVSRLTAGASAAGVDNTNRKAIERAGKNEVETAEQSANSSTATTAVTGFGVEVDKAVAAASTAGKDADEKGQSAVGAVAPVHAGAGSEAGASGIVPGIAAGHTPAEISGTKAQTGEAGTHTATPQGSLAEQDGSSTAAAETSMSHRTLLATPTALEVGLANGTQGWLKIRAEMTDGGVVNASLSSATSAGQEMLHRELPALTAYLQEERVAVNTVVVPANAAAGTESRFTGGMDREGSAQAQQGSRQGGGDDRQGLITGSSDRADETPLYIGLNGVGEDGSYSAGTYAGGGSWLNVRA